MLAQLAPFNTIPSRRLNMAARRLLVLCAALCGSEALLVGAPCTGVRRVTHHPQMGIFSRFRRNKATAPAASPISASAESSEPAAAASEPAATSIVAASSELAATSTSAASSKPAAKSKLTVAEMRDKLSPTLAYHAGEIGDAISDAFAPMLTTEDRGDGWDDVRAAVRVRQKPWREFTESLDDMPVTKLARYTGRWAKVLGEEAAELMAAREDKKK